MPILISAGLPCATTGPASIAVATPAASAVFRNCIEVLPRFYLDFACGLGGRLVVCTLSDDATELCPYCLTMLVSRRYCAKKRRLSSEHRRWSNASYFSARRLAIDLAQLGVADQAVDIVHKAEGDVCFPQLSRNFTLQDIKPDNCDVRFANYGHRQLDRPCLAQVRFTLIRSALGHNEIWLTMRRCAPAPFGCRVALPQSARPGSAQFPRR